MDLVVLFVERAAGHEDSNHRVIMRVTPQSCELL
jgi:hypothetical protein